jgi:hypothetical protein
MDITKTIAALKKDPAFAENVQHSGDRHILSRHSGEGILETVYLTSFALLPRPRLLRTQDSSG